MNIKELSCLEPGKVYVVQCKSQRNLIEIEQMRHQIADAMDGIDAKLIILSHDMEFVSIPEGYEIAKKTGPQIGVS